MAKRRDRAAAMGAPPDPGGLTSLDDLAARLRSLKAWSGLPYREIHRQVMAARTARGVVELPVYDTVYRCFHVRRRRIDVELVVDIVRVLLGSDDSDGAVASWRQACEAVLRRVSDAMIVSVAGSLPDDLPEFVGRRDELDRVLRTVDGGPAPVLVVIEGMPGIGKTQLAVRIAHELTQHERFGSTRLVVPLRGYDSDRPPADPFAVLDGMLRLLGVPGAQIQHLTLGQRAARYRQELAGRPTVILLDDAAGDEQVRPLVPERCPCLVLVTSRRSLTGLGATLRLPLDLLSVQEALCYLRRALPADWVDAEPELATRIVHLCGRLPMDLAMTAAQIRHRVDWSMADHVRRLEYLPRDESVRPALAASYRTLPVQQQRLFRLLALHPGEELCPHAAAALADVPLGTARQLLHRLLRENLLRQVAGDRYRMHDLVRTYARRLAHDEDAHSHRQDALRRLFDHYLHTACVAMDLLYPSERLKRPRIVAPAYAFGGALDGFDGDTARRWLDQERPNLLAIATQPAADDWPEHVVLLSATLHGHLDIGAHYADSKALHDLAVNLARRQDHPWLTQCLINLGNVHWRLEEHHRAVELLEQALAVSRRTQNWNGRAQALLGLGAVHEQLGQSERAVAYLTDAVAAFRDMHERDGEATALTVLGYHHLRVGNHRLAADSLRQAADIFHDVGNRDGEASALTDLGKLHLRYGAHERATAVLDRACDIFREIGSTRGERYALNILGSAYAQAGDYTRAFTCHQQALTLYRYTGSRQGEADALTRIGLVHQLTGQPKLAAQHHQQALRAYRGLNDHRGQATALNGLGETALTTGRPNQALTAHRRAHSHATNAGDPLEQARALAGLGRAHRQLGQTTEADNHLTRAFALYDQLGAHEAAHLTDHVR